MTFASEGNRRTWSMSKSRPRLRGSVFEWMMKGLHDRVDSALARSAPSERVKRDEPGDAVDVQRTTVSVPPLQEERDRGGGSAIFADIAQGKAKRERTKVPYCSFPVIGKSYV